MGAENRCLHEAGEEHVGCEHDKTVKTGPLTPSERQRLHELEDEALNAMAEEMNFTPPEWLNEEDALEWQNLRDRDLAN